METCSELSQTVIHPSQLHACIFFHDGILFDIVSTRDTSKVFTTSGPAGKIGGDEGFKSVVIIREQVDGIWSTAYRQYAHCA